MLRNSQAQTPCAPASMIMVYLLSDDMRSRRRGHPLAGADRGTPFFPPCCTGMWLVTVSSTVNSPISSTGTCSSKILTASQAWLAPIASYKI